MKNKLKNITLIMVGLTLISAIQSCRVTVKATPEVRKETVPSYIGYTKATVINSTLDGCTYLMELEDNKKLEPVNLKENFKKDGLKVWIQYTHYENFSFCMAGEMVTITAIEIRE